MNEPGHSSSPKSAPEILFGYSSNARQAYFASTARRFRSEGIPQFGLIAEEVEKINPDLVVCDEDG